MNMDDTNDANNVPNNGDLVDHAINVNGDATGNDNEAYDGFSVWYDGLSVWGDLINDRYSEALEADVEAIANCIQELFPKFYMQEVFDCGMQASEYCIRKCGGDIETTLLAAG